MINVIFNKSDYEISQRKMEMYDKYLKVIQWGRRHPVKFMEMIFGLQFTDHQRYVLLSTWTTRYAVWLMSRNSGKATCLDTIVYTNNGEKQIGDLKIGDLIYDNNNELTEVIHLNPIIFEQVYEVEFDDGEIIKCNAEHLWCVCNSKDSLFNIVETKELYNYLNNSIGNIITIPDLDGTKNIIKITKTNEKKAMRCITVSNDTGLFLCGENKTITHNSYLSAPYMMARSILIPNHKSYILCPSGNQAQQTFSKIEDLAKGKVASVKGSTGVFLAELMRANAGTDPFVHDKHSHHCELYNGSSIWTVNSVAKNAVGIRSNLNFY